MQKGIREIEKKLGMLPDGEPPVKRDLPRAKGSLSEAGRLLDEEQMEKSIADSKKRKQGGLSRHKRGLSKSDQIIKATASCGKRPSPFANHPYFRRKKLDDQIKGW